MKGKSKTVARFRREKTALYFDKCEEIKKLLSSKDQVEIDWHSLLDETPLEAPDECFFSASRLVSIVKGFSSRFSPGSAPGLRKRDVLTWCLFPAGPRH
jgi:hypothetical protein